MPHLETIIELFRKTHDATLMNNFYRIYEMFDGIVNIDCEPDSNPDDVIKMLKPFIQMGYEKKYWLPQQEELYEIVVQSEKVSYHV